MTIRVFLKRAGHNTRDPNVRLYVFLNMQQSYDFAG